MRSGHSVSFHEVHEGRSLGERVAVLLVHWYVSADVIHAAGSLLYRTFADLFTATGFSFC